MSAMNNLWQMAACRVAGMALLSLIPATLTILAVLADRVPEMLFGASIGVMLYSATWFGIQLITKPNPLAEED